jgi:hypothetical protein
MSVPDIGGLLGKISEKREELPKTERQHVVTAPDTKKQENTKSDKPVNELLFTQKNQKTAKQKNIKTGRPSLKNEDIDYVRLGCNIPKVIRQKAGDALNYERFKTPDGTVIKTLDELVTLALAQLLKE